MVRRRAFLFSAISVLLSICFVQCLEEIQRQEDNNSKFLTSLIDHLNHLPDQAYKYDDGVLISAQKKEDDIYDIEADINVSCKDGPCGVSAVKCHSRIRNGDVSKATEVLAEGTVCHPATAPDAPTVGSGEQFVAVRRMSGGGGGGVWCAGCPTDINVNAEGVDDLARKAIQHLERHRPLETHTLKNVLRVQRQAQIVNGVRYILLLDVDSTTCEVKAQDGSCELKKNVNSICQVTFLEKPWLRLADGSKFLAVLSNNCTEEYLFGNDGELLPPYGKRSGDGSDTRNEVDSDTRSNDDSNDVIDVVRVEELHASRPQVTEEMTDQRLKDVEEQIITIDDKQKSSVRSSTFSVVSSENSVALAKPIEHIESNPAPNNDHHEQTVLQTQVFIPVDEQKPISVETEDKYVPSPLSDEKKQALDAILGLFGFDPFDSQSPLTKWQADARSEDPTPKKNSSESKDSSERDSSEEVKEEPILSRSRRSSNDHKSKKNSSESKESSEEDSSKEVKDKPTPSRSKHSSLDPKSKKNSSESKESSEEDSSEVVKEKQTPSRSKHGSVDPKSKKHSSVSKENSEEDSSEVVKEKQTSSRSRRSSEDKMIIRRLADLAVNTLDDYDVDNMKRVVLQVLSSKVLALDSSTQYHMKLKIGFSKCLESEENSAICLSSLTGDAKICDVTVEVQNTGEERVLKSECFRKRVAKDRKKRAQSGIAGGIVNADINDPKFVNLAQISLGKYDLTSSSNNGHMVVKLVSASVQVVAGSLTRLTFEAKESDCPKSNMNLASCKFTEGARSKICTAEIWDRPWLKDGREITIDCVMDNNTVQYNNKVRSRRAVIKMPGAPVKVDDLNDPKLVNLAQLSLAKYDLTTSASTTHLLVKLISATKQVVAGTLTKLQFEAHESDCPKSEENLPSLESCNILENSAGKICTASVWDRPWIKDGRVITIECIMKEGMRRKRDVSAKPKALYKKTTLEKFAEYIIKHNKNYESDFEYSKRLKIFNQNLANINILNAYEQGTAIYGITRFADLTYEEFKSYHTGLNPALFHENAVPMTMATIPKVEDIPVQFDWRDQGAVTPVKNQGSCGSCWAFSVTGNVEGQWKIKSGSLLSLSEQELVDCDKLDEGCNGGLPDNAYRAIEQLGGLELESDYPYDAEDEKCSFNKSLSRVQITGAVNISSNEDDMQKWLLQNGPISIGINANAMQFYMGGVSHPFKFLCSPDNLDHGVLIVGYGIHKYPLFNKTMPYWIVKNSWGPSWGEKGYYRVYRGDGTCGVNMMASSAII